ncbi:MAG: hypothetical protein NTZ42_04485 [Candidatus Gribaldobacteria bacterium]|nr:hypothetical protein [Candidatus Gribaldobacteria bacterium]
MMKAPVFSIIPKAKETEPTWVVVAFWSLLSLLILIFAPIFIFQRQTTILAQKKVVIETETEQTIKNNAELSKRMALVSRRLNDFSQLLKSHRLNSGVFVFLSAICHPRVQFTGLSIDENGTRLTLGMKTENFKTLGEQLLILKSNPQVSDVSFSGLSVDKDGKIICSLNFNIDPKIITPSLNL